MDILRVAAATLNQTPLDWSGNTARIIAKLNEAKQHRAALICFPELCLSGYNCEDMFFSLHTARKSVECLLEIARHTQNLVAVVGLPVYHQGCMYNCAAFLQNGMIVGINPKKVLPREGVHYEPRWFEAWPFQTRDTVMIGDHEVPFGDLRYQLGDVGIGIELCEEAWDSEGAAAAHALAGVELIVNPSASHFALGKYKTRETLIADASRAMRVHYLYTNLVGLESGRVIYDGGILLGECGDIVARGGRFCFGDGELFIRDIDLNLARVTKLRYRTLKHTRQQRQTALAVEGVALPKVTAETPQIPQHYFQESAAPWDRESEFLWAQIQALFDYLRKTRSRGYVVSLSGGCDSSTTAVLVGHMIAEAVAALGNEGLAGQLHWQTDQDGPIPQTREEWLKRLLTLVYQSTQNSSQTTREAAATLAGELSGDYMAVDVQPMVSSYLAQASQLLKRSLDWQTDDLALQNIQARVRAPMVWLLANVKRAILLATSNRSESALGYTTMDGDTAGGLSPIAGIDKAFLRKWLVWAEKTCPYGLGPLSSLKLVNQQEPTAELRPQDRRQVDEDDLMPYEVLDVIERALIRDRMGPESILGRLLQRYPTVPRDQLEAYLERFLTLWSRNQWKRERVAPSFHLDDESLDPKTWCRFPILSSGFHDEIKSLSGWTNPLDDPETT
jgi:NAD+ synthase (glutamine-hydrolysing)